METSNLPEGSVQIGPFCYATPEGRIWSSRTNKFLSTPLGTNGRPQFSYVRNGENRYRTAYVHVEVCKAFHGPRPEGKVVSHRNGNMLDNRAENLTWETQSENMARREEHGTHDRGFKNSRCCVTPEQVEWVRSNPESFTHEEMAHRLGVSRTTVSRIVNEQRYVEVGK